MHIKLQPHYNTWSDLVMKSMFRICARYVHHSAAPRRQDDDAIRRCTLLKVETIAERHLK